MFLVLLKQAEPAPIFDRFIESTLHCFQLTLFAINVASAL